MKQFCFDEQWYKVSWLLPRHALGWLTLRFMSSTSSAEKQTQTFSLQSEKMQLFAWTDDITVILCVHWLWWVSRQTPSVPCDSFILSQSEDAVQPRFCLTSPHRVCKQPSQHRVCCVSTSCFLLPGMHSWSSWKVPAVETFNMDVVKRRKRLIWFLWWNIISDAAVRHFQPLLAPSFSF